MKSFRKKFSALELRERSEGNSNTMNKQRARLNLQSLKQINNHLQVLKNAFSKYNCIECGICCSEKPHEVIVLPNDPNKAQVLQAASQICPNGIVPINFTSFYVVGEKHCPFLEIAEVEKKCSIYSFRPVICRSFPYLVQSLNTKTDENGELIKAQFFVLSSACPAIAQAREEGLRFITSADILRIKKNPVLKMKLSVLVKSFFQVQQYIKQGIAFNNSMFLESEGKRIIPVF